MTLSKKLFGIVALVAALATVLVSAQLSSATHVRPKGATPFRVPIVIAYKQCTGTGNRTHGAPLAFPSCAPPVQASASLTVGTPDANGAAANNVSSVLLKVKGTSPEDVLIISSGTDIRCKAGTAAAVCPNANTADGPDYTGQLEGNAMIRISDHYNGTSLTEAATVQDIPFPVDTGCAATAADPNQGSVCAISTSANAVVAGSVKDNQRGNVEIQQIQITDGGPDGLVNTPTNTLFGVQGIFIP
jgi:hypothetical protein